MLGEVGGAEGLVLSVICLALGALILGVAASRRRWDKTTVARFDNWTFLGVMLDPKPRTRPSSGNLSRGFRVEFLLFGGFMVVIGALGLVGSIARL